MAGRDVRAMLVRRPHKGQSAFGHVDLSQQAREELAQIVTTVKAASARAQVDYHPEDRAEEGEILTTALKGFDELFQEGAAWSLERTVKEIRSRQLPTTIGAKGITGGHWSFYAIRYLQGKSDVVLVRGKSPGYGLNSPGKLLTRFIGNELKPVSEPVLSFDRWADLLVVNRRVYVLSPKTIEELFVDAAIVKGRAPQTASKFRKGINASLSSTTSAAIEHACSKNFYTARRAERLIADGKLSSITAAKVRRALPDANLPEDAFGKSGPLRAHTEDQAKVLIEICADLFYQPRFAASPRRVGAYRSLA